MKNKAMPKFQAPKDELSFPRFSGVKLKATGKKPKKIKKSKKGKSAMPKMPMGM